MYRFTLLRESGRKSPELQLLLDKYTKYIRPFAHIEHLDYRQISFGKTGSLKTHLNQVEEEILRKAPKDHTHIVLSEHGRTYPSEAFAKQLEAWGEHGAKPVLFTIGGAFGINDSLRKKADAVLSLSPLTFPHDLTEVLLCEQLYRAMTILHGKTYHY